MNNRSINRLRNHMIEYGSVVPRKQGPAIFGGYEHMLMAFTLYHVHTDRSDHPWLRNDDPDSQHAVAAWLKKNLHLLEVQ